MFLFSFLQYCPPCLPKNDYTSREAILEPKLALVLLNLLTYLTLRKLSKINMRQMILLSLRPLSQSIHLSHFFSNRLKNKDQTYVDKIRKIFSQIKINISLLDAIQQMPPYAKLLKVLCTTKRTTNVTKNAFLASNVSFIMSHQILDKYKDPSYPPISVVIGDQTIHRALLDLGLTVNLFP